MKNINMDEKNEENLESDDEKKEAPTKTAKVEQKTVIAIPANAKKLKDILG